MGGSARSRRRTCCCSMAKELRSGSRTLLRSSSSSGAVLGRCISFCFDQARNATVRSQAAGSRMDLQCFHAWIIASCVASSASARLAPAEISRTTVLPKRSWKNEAKPFSVNYQSVRAFQTPFARVSASEAARASCRSQHLAPPQARAQAQPPGSTRPPRLNLLASRYLLVSLALAKCAVGG